MLSPLALDRPPAFFDVVDDRRRIVATDDASC
jgi:hypothetical protein